MTAPLSPLASALAAAAGSLAERLGGPAVDEFGRALGYGAGIVTKALGVPPPAPVGTSPTTPSASANVARASASGVGGAGGHATVAGAVNVVVNIQRLGGSRASGVPTPARERVFSAGFNPRTGEFGYLAKNLPNEQTQQVITATVALASNAATALANKHNQIDSPTTAAQLPEAPAKLTEQAAGPRAIETAEVLDAIREANAGGDPVSIGVLKGMESAQATGADGPQTKASPEASSPPPAAQRSDPPPSPGTPTQAATPQAGTTSSPPAEPPQGPPTESAPPQVGAPSQTATPPSTPTPPPPAAAAAQPDAAGATAPQSGEKASATDAVCADKTTADSHGTPDERAAPKGDPPTGGERSSPPAGPPPEAPPPKQSDTPDGQAAAVPSTPG